MASLPSLLRISSLQVWLSQTQGHSGDTPQPSSTDGEGSHGSTEGPDVHSLRREVRLFMGFSGMKAQWL